MIRLHAAALSCLAALLLAVPMSRPTAAAESNLVATARDIASLVSESDSFLPGHELKLGLRLRLAPGWHSYWSNPGDAGEAPRLAVQASGAAIGHAGAIDWPAPRRLPDGPLMSFGYVGDVLLPVTLRLDPPPPAGTGSEPGTAASLHLSATADWLVCAMSACRSTGCSGSTCPGVPQATGLPYPGRQRCSRTRSHAVRGPRRSRPR